MMLPPMSSVPVVIYTTTYCGHCRSAKRLLLAQGIAYREVDVTHDQGARRWLIRTTGKTTVPQIFIGEKSVGGLTELSALDKAGRLAPMVAAEASASAALAEPPHS